MMLQTSFPQASSAAQMVLFEDMLKICIYLQILFKWSILRCVFASNSPVFFALFFDHVFLETWWDCHLGQMSMFSLCRISTNPPPPHPEIASLMIRAYENPLVSLKAGYEKPLFRGGYVAGGGLEKPTVIEVVEKAA